MTSFVINKATKSYDFDDGTSVPIPEEAFNEVTGKVAGKTPESLARKESFKKGLERKKSEFGEGALGSLATGLIQAVPNIATAPGDYLSAISDAYLEKKKGKTDLSLLDKVVDNYYAQKDAQAEFKNELTEKEPIASYAGKGVGLAGEVAATAALPGVAAAPLLGFANSDTSVLEPLNVAKEAAIDTAVGFGADKVFKGLASLAGRRGARQAEKAGIAEIEANNASRGRAAEAWNKQEANRFAQETTAREAEMAAIPGRQAAAQEAHAGNVLRKGAKISETLGKGTIPEAAIGIENFIANNIDRTALAGTPEANRASKFIKTVFNTGDKGVDGAHLNQAFKAIEDRIGSVQGPEKDILLSFKDYLAETLPNAMANTKIFQKYGDPLTKGMVKDFEATLQNTLGKADSKLLSELSGHLKKDAMKEVQATLSNDILATIQRNSGSFTEAIESGQLFREIEEAIINNPSLNSIKERLNQKLAEVAGFTPLQRNMNRIPDYQSLLKNLDDLPANLLQQIQKNIGKNSLNIQVDKTLARKEMERLFQQTKGAAQAIPEPAAVNAARNIAPNLEAVPALSQGQGAADKFANFLEDSNIMEKLKSLKGNLTQNANVGLMAKLAGVPIAKTVGIAGAGLGAANLLTKPGASGNIARNALKQGILQSYLSMRANNYPSFREGILDDPNDRRMFTREIEDDQSLSLEDKAMYQTKINRGQPL